MSDKPTYEELEKRVKELEQAESERKRSEDALMENEDLFRSLLSQVPSGIYLCDTKGNCQYANPCWCEMAGLSIRESLGDGWAKGLHPEDRDYVLLNWQQMVESEGKWGLEYRFQTPAGKVTWVYGLAVPLRDAMGNIIAYVGINTDITERKNFEGNLLQMAERLNLAQRAAKAGVWDWNIETGHIEWSAQMFDIFGLDPLKNSASFETWKNILHPQDIEIAANRIDNALQMKTNLDSDYRIVLPDGQIRWINAVGQGKYDEQSRPVRMIGFCMDITERKHAEEALLNVQKQLKLIFDTVPALIWQKDRQGRYLKVNNAFCQTVGLTANDIQGKTDYELFPKEIAEIYVGDDQKILDSGISEFGIEEQHQKASGKRGWSHTNKMVYRDDDGHPTGTIGFATDITERKKAETDLTAAYKNLEILWSVASMADADVKAISDHILASITRMSDSKYGFYGFVNKDESVMTIHTWSGEAMKDCAMADKPQQYPVCKSGIWAEAIRQRRPLILNDYNAALTGKKGLPEGHVPLTNLLVVPLFVNGRITAVAAVANRINDYVPEDVNQITAFLGSIQSIVERKRAEEALQESEERLRTILQTAMDGFWVLDTRGRILEVNQTYCQMSGYDEQELLTMCISDLEVIESADSTATHIQKIIASGEDRFESKHRCKNGSIFDVEVSVQYRSIEGGRFVCFLREITERKRAEDALKESENKFRMTFNFSPDSVNINRLHDGLYVDINDGFTRLTGFTRDDVIGRTSLEVGIWSDPSDRQKLLQGLREHGIYENLEAQFRSKDGKLITALMSARVISLKGVPHIISITRDITEVKLIQAQLQQAQKMESIGSLAGGIAHDLNNILFPISGLSEMLLDEMPPDTPEHESIEQIYKSAQRGSELVKQILAFSRQSNSNKLPIRIQSILKEVLKLSRSAIPMNIEIMSQIKADCGMVFADPTQIHQIAMNLITNAYHAVEQTGGSINLELKETEFGRDDLYDNSIKAGKYACISISDTGTGIDQALMDKIFDPYFTTKELGKGTGLGLSVVQGIVKEHGGDIRVYSEIGKGTVFHVYLPILKDAGDRTEATVNIKHPTGCESILLVDDEAPIVRMEQMMLERLGYQVTVRKNSPDALDAFRANPSKFDLVISDRGMPNMTGEQLAMEIISIRPDIPIILCTGFSDENDEKRAREIGVKGFLKKPVATGDLAEMVRKVLDDAAYTNG